MSLLSVSSITKENADFIRNSIQQMEKVFQPSDQNDEELIRRAVFSVRNKYIYFDKYITANSILHLTVQDVRPAKVLFNFQRGSITCDCNKTEWCRHKVSALLALYQQIDSVQEWLTNWRAQKNVSLEKLATERTPTSWIQMVHEVLNHHIKGDQKIDGNILSSIMEMTLSKLMKYVPFEREWKPIFKLFMEVNILNNLWEHIERTNSFVKSVQFEQFFDSQLESISVSVEELKGQSRLFATDPFFDELQIIVRSILLERKGYEEKKIKLYLTFWDKIFTEKKRAIEELKILNESCSINMHANVYINIFYIILKDIENLKVNIQTVKTKEIPTYFMLAQFAFSRKNNTCGEIFLKAILPHLNDFIHGHLMQQNRNKFVQQIHSLYENITLSEKEEIALFQSYGEYGLLPYSNYLLKEKRYEQWVALHQIHPSSISYLETIGLSEVLEKDPNAVLPLLHHYAITEIEQKTRINYKEASTILKKMKHAAQKLGKSNFWNDYIHYLQLKFKRLKAFQEELEKENILI